jgi:DNA-binding transcriptional regulator PaaX
MNKTKEKILLFLLAGLAFGYSYTPGMQRRVIRTVSKEWKKMSNKELRDGISYLYRLNYIEKIEHGGPILIALTKKGKLMALDCRLRNIKNKNKVWDKKWRIIAFDIPEKYKRGRDALRGKLKEIGFCELQKSVFITPYDCKEEIKMLVDFFDLDKYVRFGILDFIDNEKHLKQLFKL